MSIATHHMTPEELRQRLAAERAGLPFLLWATLDTGQQLMTLRDELDRVTVGRAEACDVRLDMDPEVSRLHAELQRVGTHWVIADDGLSRNGTFLNGERLTGRHRLRDGDVMRCGATPIDFHDPFVPHGETTRASDTLSEVQLSEGQRHVLVSLCRPMRTGGSYALPASNREIAGELFLSVQAVKAHLRALFAKLEVEDLPHNQKRLRLVERALEHRLIDVRDLL